MVTDARPIEMTSEDAAFLLRAVNARVYGWLLPAWNTELCGRILDTFPDLEKTFSHLRQR